MSKVNINGAHLEFEGCTVLTGNDDSHVKQWVAGIPRATSDGSGFPQSDRDQDRRPPRRGHLSQPSSFSRNLFSITLSGNEQPAKEWKKFASHMS